MNEYAVWKFQESNIPGIQFDDQMVIMVTHDPVAASYADRVVMLADGRIVEELTAPSLDDIIKGYLGAMRIYVFKALIQALLPLAAFLHYIVFIYRICSP